MRHLTRISVYVLHAAGGESPAVLFTVKTQRTNISGPDLNPTRFYQKHLGESSEKNVF